MAKKKEKKSWIVRVRSTDIKEVITLKCTEEEALYDPYAFCEEENEIEQEDYEVLKIEENI